MAGKTDQKAMMAKIVNDRKKKEDKEGWWKPSAGKYWIRILPPWDGAASWFIEYYVHYRIIPNAEQGESTALLCLKRTFGKDCYACQTTDVLWAEAKALVFNSPERNEAWKRASDVSPKYRMACNIILSSDPKKVLRWSTGDTTKTQLANIMVPEVEDGQEPIYVALDDAERGYNLLVEVKSVKGDKGDAYNKMFINLPQGAQPKPIIDKSVLTKLYNFDEWLQTQVKSYDEQRALLGGAVEEANPNAEVPSEEITVPEAEETPVVEDGADASIPENAEPEEVSPEVEESEPTPEPEPPAPPPKPVVKPAVAPKPAVKPAAASVAKPATQTPGGTHAARPNPADVNQKARAALKAKFNAAPTK
jgi:hypothetical protein